LGYSVKEEQHHTTPGHVMLRIEGMTCASCVETIQNFVKANPAVEEIRVRFSATSAG
jgi:copper chaperone CopZ